MAQKGRDLPLVEVEREILDSVDRLPPASPGETAVVGLAEAGDGDPQREGGGVVLTHRTTLTTLTVLRQGWGQSARRKVGRK